MAIEESCSVGHVAHFSDKKGGSVSYRPVKMSMSLRAGCLAEPSSAHVVSSLQDGDLHGADKGSVFGGALRWIQEVVTP